MEARVATPDGLDLHVAVLGREEAPPVLVVHGGPAAGHEYLLPAFATLADDFRLLLPDGRGCGGSRAPAGADLGWQRNVEDLATVAGALARGPVDVVGYSFGGLFAALLAAQRPALVRKLVLASAAPPWTGFQAPLARRLADAGRSTWVAAQRAALEQSGLREALPEEYRRRRFALSIAGYFVDPRLAAGVTPFRVQARAAGAIEASLGDYDFRDALGAIDGRRTLVVHGADDPLDVALARESAARLGARLEILPRCGHVPFVEAAEPFFAILRSFLGGAP